MINLQDIMVCLETFAPYELAEDWDNCGLMVGDRTQAISRVLCALDVTETVVQEAIERGAQMIVAHHPIIFTSARQITADDTMGRVLRQAIRHDIAIVCMHTNADCATGGVNDALAAALRLGNVVNMAAGENGLLGRVGDLDKPMKPEVFAQYVKTNLSANGVRYVCGNTEVRRVAVGGGACGKMMDAAIGKGADAFVIGDSSYDLMQRAESLGLTLIDAGHFATENPVSEVFCRVIQSEFQGVECFCSQLHHDCIRFI